MVNYGPAYKSTIHRRKLWTVMSRIPQPFIMQFLPPISQQYSYNNSVTHLTHIIESHCTPHISQRTTVQQNSYIQFSQQSHLTFHSRSLITSSQSVLTKALSQTFLTAISLLALTAVLLHNSSRTKFSQHQRHHSSLTAFSHYNLKNVFHCSSHNILITHTVTSQSHLTSCCHISQPFRTAVLTTAVSQPFFTTFSQFLTVVLTTLVSQSFFTTFSQQFLTTAASQPFLTTIPHSILKVISYNSSFTEFSQPVLTTVLEVNSSLTSSSQHSKSRLTILRWEI